MAKTKEQKQEAVKILKERLSDANATVFVNFDGLTVMETNELRNILRKEKIEYTVAKKSLLKIALKDTKIKGIDLDSLEGGLGMASGFSDEVLPAKLLDTFAKKHEAVKLIGGIFNGEFIDTKEVVALAKLPSKQELFSKLVWLLQYPTSGFVNVLAGTMRNFVYALNAIKEKKA